MCNRHFHGAIGETLKISEKFWLVLCVTFTRVFWFKVVDSCRLFSKTGSDTFRSVLICGKKQESRRKYFITMQKIHLPERV